MLTFGRGWEPLPCGLEIEQPFLMLPWLPDRKLTVKQIRIWEKSNFRSAQFFLMVLWEEEVFMLWNHHNYIYSIWSFQGTQSTQKGSNIGPQGIMNFSFTVVVFYSKTIYFLKSCQRRWLFQYIITGKYKIIYMKLHLLYHIVRQKTIRSLNTEYLFINIKFNHYGK